APVVLLDRGVPVGEVRQRVPPGPRLEFVRAGVQLRFADGELLLGRAAGRGRVNGEEMSAAHELVKGLPTAGVSVVGVRREIALEVRPELREGGGRRHRRGGQLRISDRAVAGRDGDAALEEGTRPGAL